MQCQHKAILAPHFTPQSEPGTPLPDNNQQSGQGTSAMQPIRKTPPLFMVALIAVAASPSFATQPPDPVQSDASGNTAVGGSALMSNTTGATNTAVGENAMYYNTSGDTNTAIGMQSLFRNTTGGANVGVGFDSLFSNISGGFNTASGYYALYSNYSGTNNAGFGADSLYYNVNGSSNTGIGTQSLLNNTDGSGNVGLGFDTLLENTIGSYNIALGYGAGANVTTGSNNIEIGAPGAASDNNTIQIGVQGTQSSTTIAGIYGTPVAGSAVYVTSTGRLGVQASSERYKTDITPMSEPSKKLQQLRPVTFHYKFDPQKTDQYGLIAEEVAQVYPELVIRDDKGTVQGVHYEELAPMLLKALQEQQRVIDDLRERVRSLESGRRPRQSLP
jgi:hypothetical protein